VAGWLQSRRLVFDRVPDAALLLLDSLGLTAFLALVGSTLIARHVGKEDRVIMVPDQRCPTSHRWA
jgi:hypothetical protein